MTSNKQIITVHLDSVVAISYLNDHGFFNDFTDEDMINSALVISSDDYFSGKINTLLFCSIINKIYYTDIINHQIKINDPELDFLLVELSELQYYEIIHDTKKSKKCLILLKEYLRKIQKNREYNSRLNHFSD